ncbi:NDP-hexose 2,3-dehydratase family protein [Streptomyces tendae]|uniref:NDP-hexose 2,3-dehydratase n=1 Tax=Streptomyces tendae TaxID=1932 RepID=A0A6B3QPB0_STRTE|nr:MULTISPECIES: NDP-hexose 2,3-dehydratase family protein [Streptomyces]MBQ0969417.1 NDP-hexose 2,3-dehydratase family protein [Streptomyces sp. RK74B]MBQ1009049.1 NDP-hexose 2,3-dehydratase family protein [Streptomyces sp. RK23]NEV89949.1 NDP-hexose 2,3-dehydratase [Streptomyces tendae]BET45132.1 NDP-hexose 2,3-dehydratase family protein [Kitasatospora aureofaciens]
MSELTETGPRDASWGRARSVRPGDAPFTGSTALRSRADATLPERFRRSAAAVGSGAKMSTEDFAGWLAERSAAHPFRVHRIAFDQLQGWSFEPVTGNLVHDSGRFFTVHGLRVRVTEGAHDWQQPIINQAEVGVLGILAKEFDGVLHFLMQAKMEPGNPRLVQLSPTVQATRSNYTKAHGGGSVKYLEYFTGRRPTRVLVDVLQSEHGAWFLHKANRNVIVETREDVPPDPDFCWLTLGQLGELLLKDHVVNMDSRTVLACAPHLLTEPQALSSDTELLSWITAEKAGHQVRAEPLPLAETEGWVRTESAVRRLDDRFFRVVAVRAEAANREVAGWTQPLFEPVATGVTAFLTGRFGGVPHLLVHARAEGGFLESVELGPTVQCVPDNYRGHAAPAAPRFLDLVLNAAPHSIRYSALHSEEGGRFLNAVSRHLVVDVDTAALSTPPEGYRWVTPGQLNWLARHSRYVNVQARSLLAALNSGAVRL